MDTGSNKNYIIPKKANFENCLDENGIFVSNINGKHSIKKSLLLDIFNINKKIKFYIFHFHDYFDGLIGFETLRDLDGYFDIGKNMLKIGKKEYQLKKKYPDYQSINNTDEVRFIKIETKSKNDLVVGEETGC